MFERRVLFRSRLGAGNRRPHFDGVVPAGGLERAVEAQCAQPLYLRLPAIAVFFAIACGAWLWGAAGALVATPLLILAAVFVRRPTTAPGFRSGTARQNERGGEREKWHQ